LLFAVLSLPVSLFGVTVGGGVYIADGYIAVVVDRVAVYAIVVDGSVVVVGVVAFIAAVVVVAVRVVTVTVCVVIVVVVVDRSVSCAVYVGYAVVCVDAYVVDIDGMHYGVVVTVDIRSVVSLGVAVVSGVTVAFCCWCTRS